MSDLIVIGFNDEFKADEVLLKLSRKFRQHSLTFFAIATFVFAIAADYLK